MANVISTGGGATVTMLASLTSIPTSNTATSGTENWKEYDAIYFECFMHYSQASDTSVYTNLILTDNVSIGDRYQPIRVPDAGARNYEISINCYFSENVLNIYKTSKTYDATKLNIYGVKF